MKKSKLILIDADFILWKTVPNKVLTETEKMYGAKSEKNLQETLDLVDWYIKNKIFIPTEATHYIGCIGGRGNFRKKLTSGYKANRSTEFPKYFNLAKQYLIEEYGFVESNGFEAEDYVSHLNYIFSSEPNNHIFKVEDIVIIREDHDLNQTEGIHYNPRTGITINIDNKTAKYNFWEQMLIGCRTDKVPGLPGTGEKKAEKFLTEITKPYPEYILELYINHFGISEGIYQFTLNFRQLYILQTEQDFLREVGEIPQIPEINKVILNSQVENNIDLTKLEF